MNTLFSYERSLIYLLFNKHLIKPRSLLPESFHTALGQSLNLKRQNSQLFIPFLYKAGTKRSLLVIFEQRKGTKPKRKEALKEFLLYARSTRLAQLVSRNEETLKVIFRDCYHDHALLEQHIKRTAQISDLN